MASVPSALARVHSAPASDRALHSFNSRLVFSGVGGVGRQAFRAFRGFKAGDFSDQLFPVRLAAGQRDWCRTCWAVKRDFRPGQVTK